MPKTITALMVKPGKGPQPIRLYTNENYLKYAVSMESPYLCSPGLYQFGDGVGFLFNSEATLLGLPWNRRIADVVVAGVFYVVGIDEEENLTSLPYNAMDDCWIALSSPETYLRGKSSFADLDCVFSDDTFVL